jgi:16S rRNA (cytosine1402-N4)-methyltransferase
MAATHHIPVLASAVLQGLSPKPGQTVVDATLGGAGHGVLLAQTIGPTGHLIGLDQDPIAIGRSRAALEAMPSPPKLSLVHARFDGLRQVLDSLNVPRVDAVLADLGVSSDQLGESERGFSFQKTGPLDMRLDPEGEQTAASIIASWNERDLADLFWQLGEERFSRRIAKKIVAQRKQAPIETTTELADLVRSCLPRSRHGIDPATRTFQALRIAVNDELGALKRLLSVLPDCLRPGGCAAIISFHSLEDRLVKKAFKDTDHWQAVTKKPIIADEEEVNRNPRSRSAKLRIAKLVHQ